MYIQLNGQILFYEKSGEGSPCILLHGNEETHEIFQEAIQELEQHFTVYAIDTRGHGLSATPKEYHYTEMAEDIIQFILSLKLEHPVLCGFSDGGIIGLYVAMSQKVSLSHFICCGANLTPKGLHHSIRSKIKSNYRKTKNPLMQLMLQEPFIPAEDLNAITVPTLVTAGEHDFVKEKETRKIADSIPNATLSILPGEDHGSYIIHSKKIASIILDFTKH